MMLHALRDWFGRGNWRQRPAQASPPNHEHIHGIVDPSIATTTRGIWAIKWSFVILVITALAQFAVVVASGSVALLADTIHNIGDAATAIPLWVAFALARRTPTTTFSYGLGRAEDFAGVAIVLVVLASALFTGYEAIGRLFHPQAVEQIAWVAGAGIVGFAGNEAVAIFRIRVGRQINSVALIADGYHARTDALTSLAVVASALGVWLGIPLADPVVGLLITLAIFGVVWQSGRTVFTHMLDGVEPGLVDEIRHAAGHVAGVDRVTDAKARWIGHKLHAEMTIAVDRTLTLRAANSIAAALRRELLAHLPALAAANIHFESHDEGGSPPDSAGQGLVRKRNQPPN